MLTKAKEYAARLQTERLLRSLNCHRTADMGNVSYGHNPEVAGVSKRPLSRV
jgi:hypothetical protein